MRRQDRRKEKEGESTMKEEPHRDSDTEGSLEGSEMATCRGIKC